MKAIIIIDINEDYLINNEIENSGCDANNPPSLEHCIESNLNWSMGYGMSLNRIMLSDELNLPEIELGTKIKELLDE